MWKPVREHSERLPAALDTPEIHRALEELNVLTQNELERERYLARVKLQRDELSRLHSAREEGREKGREEGLEVGQAIGVIHFCQHRLKLPQTPTDQLRTMGLEPLRKMAQQLEAELPQ